jgi:hypothetical protein
MNVYWYTGLCNTQNLFLTLLAAFCNHKSTLFLRYSLFSYDDLKRKTMTDLTLGIGSRVKHAEYKLGVVVQVWNDTYDITFMEYGLKEIMKTDPDLEVVEFVSMASDLVSYADIEKAIRQIVLEHTDFHPVTIIGKKWIDGTIILKPGEEGLQQKEFPIETFFHKIVMVRDRLRVMEQRINSSKLSEEEKVNLQQYITRIYGSLTTFNVLFDDKEDSFRGEKKA